MRQWHESFDKRDADLRNRLLTEDTVFVNAFGVEREGKESVAAFWKELFASGTFDQSQLTVPREKIRFLRPDLAIVDRFEDITGQRGVETGKPLPPRKVHLTFVVTKTDRGWLVASTARAICVTWKRHGERRTRIHMRWGRVVALLSCLLLTSVLGTPRRLSATAEDTEVRLSTIPRRVFVDDDGIVEPWPTESFVFFLVVEDEGGTPVEPLEARIELLSRGEPVQVEELSARALQGVRGVRFKTIRVGLSETFDLRHHFSVPVALNVDRVRYRLTLTRGGGALRGRARDRTGAVRAQGHADLPSQGAVHDRGRPRRQRAALGRMEPAACLRHHVARPYFRLRAE